MKTIFFVAALFVFSFICLGFGFSFYESVTLGMFVFYLLKITNDFGNSIYITLDVIVIQAMLTWLVVPILFFHFYNQYNHLAVLWVKTMPISSDAYYSFVLPGTIALIIGLQENTTIKQYFNSKIKVLLNTRSFNTDPSVGITIIMISACCYLVSPFAPSWLGFILYLAKKMMLVGLIYLYFLQTKFRNLYLLAGIVFLILGGIQSALFGELIFLSLLFAILLSIQFELKFVNKLLIAVTGVFLIFIFQNIKSEYRKVAWTSGGNSKVFTYILIKNITEPEFLFDSNRQFANAVRFNQGWLIASTMNRVPRVVPFANGETILLSLAGSVVPRFLWPDKPESGGQYNLTRFLGYGKLNYSMNISPIGESYANFGRFGGVIFMFIYGLFFRFAFHRVLKISETRPTILFWIPILFQYSVGVETDVLSTVNSLIKSSIFVFILYKIWPRVFGTEL